MGNFFDDVYDEDYHKVFEESGDLEHGVTYKRTRYSKKKKHNYNALNYNDSLDHFDEFDDN